MKDIFKVFANCLMTCGSRRALISDVQRGIYYTIPLSLYHLLIEKQNNNIEDVKMEVCKNEEELKIINEYFNFLIENEIIFICDEKMKDSFPPISTTFLYPAIISNAIIRFKNVSDEIKFVLSELVKVQCYNIEITITSPIDLSDLLLLLSYCKESEMNNVNLLINLSSKLENNITLSNYPFISSIIFYSYFENKEEYNSDLAIKIIYTTQDLSANIHCGIIDKMYFTPNLPHYTESLHHNTCLNRKISIDTDGNIKNCPSMKESFGNIKDTTLEEAVNKPGFKKYWNITKDQIAVCRDCEFRHVCTDCRAYLEDPEDEYSKPLKCGYDPYTCKWEEWSANPLKQKAIDYYGMRELVK